MIKFANLSIHDGDVHRAVADVLHSGQFVRGTRTKEFCRRWAALSGRHYGEGFSSGSAALLSAFMAIRYVHSGYSNYVAVLPALSFVATATSAHFAGFDIAYCDVDETGVMDQNKALELIRSLKVRMPRTLFVTVPVYLYGAWFQLKKELFLEGLVLEDACQAHGHIMQGSLAAFSFYPSKNLGAGGEAGALVSDSKGLIEAASAFSNYGDYADEKFVHNVMGDNLRMSEIQAAVLKVKLDKLRQNTSHRISVADDYARLGVEALTTGVDSNHHLYPILVEDRAEVRAKLLELGVETGNHYPYTLPTKVKPRYSSYSEYPIARDIAEHVLTLPIGSHIRPIDVKTVVDGLKSICDYDRYWKLK